ncbi:hypothetical protein PTKIN_Ptkin05aG0144600 [Pterospermum kingtungense]
MVKHLRGQARKGQGCLQGITLVGKARLGKNMKNREFKNSKFGYGGRKGLKKQNTAETTNDLRGFNKGSVAGNKKRKR